MPFQASLSTLDSCSPEVFFAGFPSAEGRPTPSDGGMKPGGGALMADGAMRECRMCARDDRMATCIDCQRT